VPEVLKASDTLTNGALVRVLNRSRGLVLAERAQVAASPLSRMRGLLARPPLAIGQGLLIVPCQGVHSFGMGYPIDVLHLDRQLVVRRVVRSFRPWRIGPLVWRAHLAVELPAGSASGTIEGDRLALRRVEPDEQS
jgi:uncharacterized membrane protein (UPF0127 family)